MNTNKEKNILLINILKKNRKLEIVNIEFYDENSLFELTIEKYNFLKDHGFLYIKNKITKQNGILIDKNQIPMLLLTTTWNHVKEILNSNEIKNFLRQEKLKNL